MNSSERDAEQPSVLIEDFQGDWQKEWFTYRPEEWARSSNRLYDEQYQSPPNAKLALDVHSVHKNELVIRIDHHAAEVQLSGGDQWQQVVLAPKDFQNHAGEELVDWNGIKRLTLSAAERLQPDRGDNRQPRIVGGNWRGTAPRFRNLRWQE